MRGMLSNLALFSSWAKVTPPSALIAWKPRVPSVPPPDRIVQTRAGLLPSGPGAARMFSDAPDAAAGVLTHVPVEEVATMLELTVNGARHSVDVSPDTPLLWVV